MKYEMIYNLVKIYLIFKIIILILLHYQVLYLLLLLYFKLFIKFNYIYIKKLI